MTREEALERYQYVEGRLFHRGREAGHLMPQGYRRITWGRKRILTHRLIYWMAHGFIPEQIDHINGIKDDNRIENLREASNSTNMQNTILQRNNSSGVKGVWRNKRLSKWQVQVMAGNIKYYGGIHEDLEFAEFVAQELREKYHGAFANHG